MPCNICRRPLFLNEGPRCGICRIALVCLCDICRKWLKGDGDE